MPGYNRLLYSASLWHPEKASRELNETITEPSDNKESDSISTANCMDMEGFATEKDRVRRMLLFNGCIIPLLAEGAECKSSDFNANKETQISVIHPPLRSLDIIGAQQRPIQADGMGPEAADHPADVLPGSIPWVAGMQTDPLAAESGQVPGMADLPGDNDTEQLLTKILMTENNAVDSTNSPIGEDMEVIYGPVLGWLDASDDTVERRKWLTGLKMCISFP